MLHEQLKEIKEVDQLKGVSNFRRQFAVITTGGETWVHQFE